VFKKLSAQRNETETKQFHNSFETVLKLFFFQPKQNAPAVTARDGMGWNSWLAKAI